MLRANTHQQIFLSIAALVIPLLSAGCATTNLTSSWKDPEHQGQPRRILVIGVARRPAIKRIFEDEFVRRLEALGTEAIASYTVMLDEQQGDRAVIAAKLVEQGADAVLISRLVSKRTVQVYVPGGPSYPPAYYGSWRDFYGVGFQAASSPGYVTEDQFALMESNLYDAGSDKLIWSATSETELLGSDESRVRSYIGVLVGEMARQKVIE
jgi:hypothetical protein